MRHLNKLMTDSTLPRVLNLFSLSHNITVVSNVALLTDSNYIIKPMKGH